MPDPQETIVNAVRLLVKRHENPVEVTLDADLFDDLGLDSLEVAELSASLEDDLGRDPYSEGLMPRTIAEVAAFYG